MYVFDFPNVAKQCQSQITPISAAEQAHLLLELPRAAAVVPYFSLLEVSWCRDDLNSLL